VKDSYETIRQLGGEVLVVSFSGPKQVRAYLDRYPLPFPAVSDPERVAYRAFALEKTSWASFLRPRVIGRYLRLMFRGWAPHKAQGGEDVLQLGGDFVIDRQERLVYAYRSKESTDRPSAKELVEAVRKASGEPLAPGET
jgi:peroxiredoxin